MQASVGLSYSSSIASHFLNFLHWMVFDLFFIVWHEKRSEVCVVNRCQCIGNIANAFENTYSALKRVSNSWKTLWRIFNAFSTYLLCRVFTNRVTTHPTETALRHLVFWSFRFKLLWSAQADAVCFPINAVKCSLTELTTRSTSFTRAVSSLIYMRLRQDSSCSWSIGYCSICWHFSQRFWH